MQFLRRRHSFHAKVVGVNVWAEEKGFKEGRKNEARIKKTLSHVGWLVRPST
jgi:hypothetical protein